MNRIKNNAEDQLKDERRKYRNKENRREKEPIDYEKYKNDPNQTHLEFQ